MITKANGVAAAGLLVIALTATACGTQTSQQSEVPNRAAGAAESASPTPSPPELPTVQTDSYVVTGDQCTPSQDNAPCLSWMGQSWVPQTDPVQVVGHAWKGVVVGGVSKFKVQILDKKGAVLDEGTGTVTPQGGFFGVNSYQTNWTSKLTYGDLKPGYAIQTTFSWENCGSSFNWLCDSKRSLVLSPA